MSPRKLPGPPCAVCGKPSVAKKLCATHYKRLKRHGTVDRGRPDDWSKKRTHPLSETWRGMRRAGGRDPRWNDFWAFVAEVGERPSPKHLLKRQNLDRPFGPDNWYWADPVNDGGIGDGRRAARAEYAREWRRLNPLKAKANDLKKYFGISLAEYEDLLQKQGGGCAICGKQDDWYNLAVDHCHTTNRIRGLLCSRCNRGLGFFRDQPELLEKAAAYLRYPTRLI